MSGDSSASSRLNDIIGEKNIFVSINFGTVRENRTSRFQLLDVDY